MFSLKIIIKKTITDSLQVTDKVNLLQSHRLLRKNTLRSCSAQTACFLHCNTFKVSECANDQQVTVIQSCSSFKHGNHPAALQTKHAWFTKPALVYGQQKYKVLEEKRWRRHQENATEKTVLCSCCATKRSSGKRNSWGSELTPAAHLAELIINRC